MPKLYSAKVVLSSLQRAGFSIVSQKGSHIKLFKRKGDKNYTAGMTKKEFEKFVK